MDHLLAASLSSMPHGRHVGTAIGTRVVLLACPPDKLNRYIRLHRELRLQLSQSSDLAQLAHV